MNILYITYDGVLEPLGQSQVLAYLKCLAKNHCIHLVSFEKIKDLNNSELYDRINNDIVASGIIWHSLVYHKRPSFIATAWDITSGITCGLWLVFRYRLQIIHARSYVASVMALAIKRITGIKFLFDMRGFWADERVEGGLWKKNGNLYSIAKIFEKRFLISADFVVALTHVAVKEMQFFPYLQGRIPKFEVITTCTNLEVFNSTPYIKNSKKNDKQFILGYVGSVGVSYRFEETLIFFNYFKQIIPDSVLYIINRDDHKYILERLSAHGINERSFRLEELDHSNVAKAICTMDAGIFFINQSYSKMASAPTKLGEFLGCGVPCLCNSGVGDMASILEGENIGIVLKNFDETSMRNSIQNIINLAIEPDIQQRCRNAALKYFSLEKGVNQYDQIYQSLIPYK